MSAPRPPELDELAQLLESTPHVDDAGFADRVMGALPPRPAPRFLTRGLVPTSAMAACAVAYGLCGRAHGLVSAGELSPATLAGLAGALLSLVLTAAVMVLPDESV